MEKSKLFLLIVLLIDSFLWGVWFGGLWSYRLAFASRLSSDYIHISISYALPLFSSSIVFLVAMRKQLFFRLYRLALFKLSILFSRMLFLVSSVLVTINVFDNLKLLYVSSAIFSLASGFGSIAGVAWTDYVADNIPDNLKHRYVALDSLLGTIGALAGSSIAGYIFAFEKSLLSYGKLFLVVSTIFLLDTPLIIMLKDYAVKANTVNVYSNAKPATLFYIAIAILFLSLNLPTSLTAPYIIYKLGGDELWITAMNISTFVASIATPIAFSEILKKVKPLTLARISIALSATSTAIFPQLKTVELQVARAFASGAGGIGVWMSLLSHIISEVDSDKRIGHSSTIYLIQNIAPAIATSIGGALADILKNPEPVFYISSMAIASIPMIKTYEHQNKNK